MYLQSAREVLGTMDDKPKWASDLELSVCGQFYQGFVDDYTLVLAQHCMATVLVLLRLVVVRSACKREIKSKLTLATMCGRGVPASLGR